MGRSISSSKNITVLIDWNYYSQHLTVFDFQSLTESLYNLFKTYLCAQSLQQLIVDKGHIICEVKRRIFAARGCHNSL